MRVAWENSQHLAMLPLVSPPKDVWEASTEIPYWRPITTQIWVVLVIGWIKFPTLQTNHKYYPDLGSDLSSVLNFCIPLSDSDTVRWDDVKELRSHWNFVKTKTMTPGNNIYTLLVTFITFTSFISSKARFKRWTLHVPNLIRGEKKYHPYCLK